MVQGTEVNFLQQTFMKSRALYTLPIPLTTCRRITEKKQNGIVSALKGVCEEKRIFWEDICITLQWIYQMDEIMEKQNIRNIRNIIIVYL